MKTFRASIAFFALVSAVAAQLPQRTTDGFALPNGWKSRPSAGTRCCLTMC
jgi:hypothetical protein